MKSDLCFNMTRVLITYNVTPHIWGIAIISAPSKRRIQCLARLGFSMLLARGEARAYSHVAWLSVITFAYLIIELQELAWLIIPTLCLFCTLGIIVLYDVRYFVIPDKATSLLLVCGALVVLLIDANDLPVRTGAAIGAYGSLKIIASIYEWVRKEAGLGQGDAKLFGVTGLWLGLPGLATCLMLAIVSALVSAAIMRHAGALENARQPIPFGPHLALGIWLVWTFGPLESY